MLPPPAPKITHQSPANQDVSRHPAPARLTNADLPACTTKSAKLQIHLGESISLDEADLIDKIVGRWRGGFCYELNGAFACLLECLGARVRRVSARVYGDDGGLGPPFDHLALVVRLPDGTGPWLADVGFGSHSTYPLPADVRAEQAEPGGRFLLAGTPDGDIDVVKDGQPQHCSRLTEDGRVSISGRRLIRTVQGQRFEENLAGRPGRARRLPGSFRNPPQHRARARGPP